MFFPHSYGHLQYPPELQKFELFLFKSQVATAIGLKTENSDGSVSRMVHISFKYRIGKTQASFSHAEALFAFDNSYSNQE